MTEPALQATVKAHNSGRIVAFDGLRGVAALVVVVFHYLAMLHPEWVADYASSPAWVIDTPLAVLWNGPFAVSVFFVLSGFVMAAAAERRHRHLVENVLTRYLRLALPVLASVLLAWVWLTLFPTAAQDLMASLENPSKWVAYTYQAPLPGIGIALQDGLASNFITGGSGFNNVLWTMQVELVGSIFLFVVYWLGAASRVVRFAALAAFGVLGLFVLRDAYLCFFAGAVIYEARKAGILERLPPWWGVLALALGVVLGAPGEGFAERWGLDVLPGRLQPGNDRGLVPVLAASLILLGVQLAENANRLFRHGSLQWLGRVSFALYLVHVPLLYTVVAWERVNLGLPEALVAAAYLAITLALAHAFTLGVDEPSLNILRRLRSYSDGLRAQGFAAPTTSRRAQGPLWPWALLGAAALLPMTLINGGAGIYYDSVVYLHRPDGFLTLLSMLPLVDAVPVVAAEAVGAAAPAAPETAAAAASPEAPRIIFSGRSMVYQIFAWTGLEFGRLWSLAAAQALMVAYPAALLTARVLGVAPGWPFVLGLGALGLLTPLGLFTGIAMPDVLSGVLVLTVAALMAGWSALSWVERVILFAIAGFAMVSHTSHLLLGLTLPAVLLLLPLRNGAMWRGAAVIWLACISAAGLGHVQTILQTRDGDIMLTRPHLVAHLVDHGPGVTYLRRNCPEAGFEMCNHVAQLPIGWREFLFGGSTSDERFFVAAGPEVQRAISDEQFALTRSVIADDPVAVMDFAARAWLRQMARFDPAGGLVQSEALSGNGAEAPPWLDPYPGWLQTQVRSLSTFNSGWMLPALHASTWVTTLLALGVLGWNMRRHGALPAGRGAIVLCLALLLGVVLNAAICGILASPYDRFQARIVWLIPLAALTMLAARAAPRARPVPRDILATDTDPVLERAS